MKKIGFVIPWFADDIPGGAEAELRGLVSHLSKAGMELEVLTTCIKQADSDWGENYYKEGADTAAGVPVRRFPVEKRDEGAFGRVVSKLHRDEKISLSEEMIYIDEMYKCPSMYEYMKKNEDDYEFFVFIPYLFATTYYGCKMFAHKAVVIPCLHDESYAYLKCFRDVFTNVRGMIFHALPEYELADKLYDLSAVNAQVLGEGIYTDMSGDADRFRQKYEIDNEFVLYAGRKDIGKGVHLLPGFISAYNLHNDSDIKLILIGGGDISIASSDKKYVIDLGYVPIQDKYDAMSAALCLCQPSTLESFSLVVMESFICGRPVIVNEMCAVTSHFARVSGGGLYFSDYRDFAGCVDYFLSNPETARIMGENGRKFAVENFNWDVIVEKYTKYFHEISNEISNTGGNATVKAHTNEECG